MQETEAFKRLLDSMDSGGLLFGPNRELLYANHMIRKLVEVKGETLDQVGLAVFATNLFYPDDRPIPPEERPTSLAFSTKTEIDNALAKFISPSGRLYWLRGRSIPILGDHDEVLFVITTLSDITKAEENRRIQDQFIANASHELRTPLAITYGFTSPGMLDSSSRKEILHTVGVIHRQARSMRWLVENVLTVFRLDNNVSAKFSSVCLADVVRDCIEAMQIIASEKGVKLTYRILKKPRIVGNAVDVGLVLNNLVDNAIKFSPGGQVRVTLKQSKGGAVISVSDNGIGITEEIQKIMWGRFVQGDGTDTRRFGGIGIGLYVADLLIKRHNGRIGVTSMVGQGSTFTVYLPLLND